MKIKIFLLIIFSLISCTIIKQVPIQKEINTLKIINGNQLDIFDKYHNQSLWYIGYYADKIILITSPNNNHNFHDGIDWHLYQTELDTTLIEKTFVEIPLMKPEKNGLIDGTSSTPVMITRDGTMIMFSTIGKIYLAGMNDYNKYTGEYNRSDPDYSSTIKVGKKETPITMIWFWPLPHFSNKNIKTFFKK